MPLTFTLITTLALLACLAFPTSLWLLSNQIAVQAEWQIRWLSNAPYLYSLILEGEPLLFFRTVIIISSSVIAFSHGYIEQERHFHRFTLLLLIFIISIVLLLFSANLVAVILGWDGLGLTSYLLVIFYQAPRSQRAGLVVALTNRLGDIGLIFAIGIAASTGNWSITSGIWSFPLALTIILAALTKSAQFPFSRWLPLAIAAPTPVSALVHSSTLVTAGVYLLLRSTPAVSDPALITPFLLWAGTITMLIAGCAALVETDIKKIVALSTLSQLGVIFCALGLNSPHLALFHLLTHAIFKALLFLCVGTYLHYHHHQQDYRTIGNLINHLPVTQSAATLAQLALIGTPFLAAFYSKEPIFELGASTHINSAWLTLIIFGLALTIAYSTRFTLTIQFGPNQQTPLTRLHNERLTFLLPLLGLSLIRIIWGATLNWLLLPSHTTPPGNQLIRTAPLILIFLVPIMTLFFIALQPSPLVYSTSSSLWFLDNLTAQPLTALSLNLGRTLLKSIEHGWMENQTAGGTAFLSRKSNSILQQLQQTIPTHLLIVALSSLLFLFFLI